MFILRPRPTASLGAGHPSRASTPANSPRCDHPGAAIVLILCVLGVLALPVAPAAAQESIAAFDEEKGASRIELTGVFSPPPPTGFQPVRVQVTNATGEKRSWRIEFDSEVGWNNSGRMRSSFEVAAEPGNNQSTLLVPMQTAVTVGRSVYGGGQHQLQATLTSNRGGRHTASVHSQRAQNFPAIAISDALAVKNLTKLNDTTGSVAGSGYSHEKLFGSRFAPDHLPDNWLGYSGFDHVMITTDEWLALAPGSRTALLQAVQFGLHLHLYRSNPSVTLSTLGIPTIANVTGMARGMGRIEVETWDGDTLDDGATVAKFHALRERGLIHRLSNDYASPRWGLLTALGDRSFAGWQVVAFLVVFGILIGPVNLFMLAPAGRRHKLFFTTPLISLGASLLLIALILVQDGTGGEGRRFIAIHLPPDEPAAYVTQEQISRTGVVLGSSFTLPRPGQIAQAVLDESPWAKYNDGHASQPMDTRLEGAQTSGNWFQSRALQAQFLRSLVPTRGRIELVSPKSPGEAPTIVSSLDVELTTFVYLDADGTTWRAKDPVSQGRPVTLVQDSGAWGTEVNRFPRQTSSGLAARIGDVAIKKPAFMATAAKAPGFAIDTLASIRWADDQILLFGNLPATP